MDSDYEDSFNYLNSTDDEYEEYLSRMLWPTPLEKTFVGILLVQMILGVVGNSLVVIVVISKKSMWSSMNIALTNLACADLLVLIFCLPPTVINDVTKTFWFSTLSCKLIVFLQNTTVYVSILSLVFITFERWRAITYPLKRPLANTRYVIAATWLIAICLASPEPFTLQLTEAAFDRPNFSSIWGTQCRETWTLEFQQHYGLAQALGSYFAPVLFISVMCLHMSRTLNNCELTIAKRQLAQRKKAVRMLVGVVFLFALSYLPVHIYNLASAFDLLSIEIDMNLIAIRKLAPRVFSYSSSCLNPLLYNFMSGRFRAEFARVICLKWAKTPLGGSSGKTVTSYNDAARRHYSKSYHQALLDRA